MMDNDPGALGVRQSGSEPLALGAQASSHSGAMWIVSGSVSASLFNEQRICHPHSCVWNKQPAQDGTPHRNIATKPWESQCQV